MLKATLPLALASVSVLLIFTKFAIFFVNSVKSATATDVVISEVQVGAGDANAKLQIIISLFCR